MAFNYESEFGDIRNYTANIYLVRHDKRSLELSYSRIISDSDILYESMLDSYANYLYGFTGREVESFNPVGNSNTALPIMNLSKINEKFEEIKNIISERENIRQQDVLDANGDNENLIVADITTDNGHLYLISSYANAVKWFKYKNVFLHSQGRLQKQNTDDILALNYNIDVAIYNETVYIFNIPRFKSIFDYDENIKKSSNTLIPRIKNWKIIGNYDVFVSFAGKKYFYQGLAKIAEDEDYLKAIESCNCEYLKASLIKKSNGVFTDADFDLENRLLVSKKNCKNIIKMLAKEFNYNVFTDSMEE